ncbi:dTDP-4-dehydrorhamnose reductase [Neobacillus jeddahensis]|uniref:dTDP-4-dehydrorhamnose reductase n=1 Tax=Neobacillus jeddahensis TaxID=1461580 RepID=UPI00058C436A|nr:dTDP-4-dehydrorhamnose reductase [Neobacillus jeddahensis]
MKKVLVTGAEGQLGSDLVLSLKMEGYKVYGLGKSQLNISNLDEVNKIVAQIVPDIIIHCAAFTHVDLAEINVDQAFLVNGIGTRNIAIAADHINAKLIYISTDYVFDGQSSTPYHEFSPVSPINQYGHSKLAGENFVRDFHSRFFIIRTSWVYGKQGNNFVKTMLMLAKEKDELRVVNDQIGCPTYTMDLAQCINQLMETSKYGTYHVSNSGYCTWFEFAKEIFQQSNLSPHLIPCSTEEFPRPAPRPKYSIMDHLSLRINDFDPMPHWKNGLERFFQQIHRSK